MKFFNWFFIILAIVFIIPLGCRKPFDGVSAILSNSYIKYRVSGQIIDANSAATNPYPAKTTVTITGDAVTQGLIYDESGQQILTGDNNIQVTANSFTVVVKPYYIISKTNPLKLSLLVSASGYVSNNKDFIITDIDSLQYLTIKLLNISVLPPGVSYKVTNIPLSSTGSIKSDTTIAISNNATSNTAASQLAKSTELRLKSNTSFYDASGNTTLSSSPISFALTAFSGMSKEAISSIPGGVTNVTTSKSTNTSFTLGGAIDINATLGGTPVKSLNQPIIAKIVLDSSTLNPTTNTNIKVGDSIETWSSDQKTNVWTYEGKTIIFRDPATNKMSTNILITHFSVWATCYSSNLCTSPFTINYTTTDSSTTTLFIEIVSQTGNKQVINSKKVSVKNGDKVVFTLSQGIPFSTNIYIGSDATGLLSSSSNFDPCAAGVTFNYVVPQNKPVLFFDLQTVCTNGIFRYTGPIDYKVNGTNTWKTFTPSNNGTMTTSLLDWNTTYDFRIIYKGVEYKRTRQILQAEFRQTTGGNNSWYFWGKDPANKQTFFNSPTACN
jgi:hypothetical protein